MKIDRAISYELQLQLGTLIMYLKLREVIVRLLGSSISKDVLSDFPCFAFVTLSVFFSYLTAISTMKDLISIVTVCKLIEREMGTNV